MATARQNGCSHPTLPMCLRYVTEEHIKEAKSLSKPPIGKIKGKGSSVVKLTPRKVDLLLFLSVCARQYDKVWEAAQILQNDPVSLRFQTNSIYLLLLLLISQKKDSSEASLALNLYRELCVSSQLTKEEHELAATMLFSIFDNCSDFTLLLLLKSVYESVVVPQFGADLEYLYISACLNIHMNSGNYEGAVLLLERYMATLFGTDDVKFALEALPMLKLVDDMCTFHDCETLHRWVKIIQENNEDLLQPETWMKILGLGLLLNDFPIVKLVYEKWIMAGLSTQLQVEEVIFENSSSVISKLNGSLKTLSDTTLHQILHTLSSHGDVELTLNLIEWHYIHKSLRGEKALTKELCADIIRSYCYYEDLQTDGNGQDKSMERVLDVLNSFVSRPNTYELSYKDISDSVSHKINNLKIEDQNVVDAQKKTNLLQTYIEKSNEEGQNGELPRKVTTTPTNQGNTLLNTKLLSTFVETHIKYLLETSAHTKTIHLFVNCILNHMAKYQNLSGVIVALQSLKILNDNYLHDWLTMELFDIIIRSISNSPASRATGLELYKYLAGKDTQFTEKDMLHFIFLSLRGPEYHDLLEFYLFQYLCMGFTMSTQLIRRISKFTHLDHRGRLLLEFLEENQKPEVEDVKNFWSTHDLNSLPKFAVSDRSTYDKIDARDCSYLKLLLGNE